MILSLGESDLCRSSTDTIQQYNRDTVKNTIQTNQQRVRAVWLGIWVLSCFAIMFYCYCVDVIFIHYFVKIFSDPPAALIWLSCCAIVLMGC